MNKTLTLITAATVGFATLAHAGPEAVSDEARGRAVEAMKRDFQAKGIAGTDRLVQDGVQAICNRSGNKPAESIAKVLQADQLTTIKLPADGKLMGDWKAGETLAQSGRGMTWSDKAGIPNGGNCYNCHQLSPKELSYGTIGPSLMHFGKIRGNTPDMQKYAYQKIYNAKAFNLCSEMPRFGHADALTEKQIKDLVALLLDPESPVNK